ncbi:SLC13 family permease [Hydrogenimonas thermophila]|uniref:Solute carrier family 13 (Sodium-dependent dicarboxylate transporter), member 2/3/5 n=1 Tax=Hydrogenimonas thermophila TaxID=223786 RepID=A0A1I5L6I5_9BACT|nr:SLC13 family permease [Hydrogenimonas thermophila]SFO92802.1 solute carrier family 13 (sodium-dependent dicarboxylate transporter), member 2/3/5 [Hydrogenimonas thermophila]
MFTKEVKGILIAIAISILAYFLSGLVFNDIESKLIAVVALLVTLWTNEALPLGVVSLLPIVLFPTLGILDPKSVSANYSKTIIFLFLGGFLLAIAVEKTGLHKIIANKLLNIFPKTNRGIIFSLSITSALLSSFLSNTTTALLLMPIALFLTDEHNLKIRFVLAIAYGASIGGIITPIGTPPNLILMGFLQDNNLESLSFVVWMAKTLPLAIVMLVIVSSILSLGLKKSGINVSESVVRLNIDQRRLKNILLLLIAILLVNSFLKFNESVILLSFGLAMFLPKIGFLIWDDAKKIPYEIIFLFGAGFSIASGFSSTGLAKDISNMLLELTTLPPIMLILIVATLITFTTEITSNTALTSIALPIIYALGKVSSIDTYLILMVATICASYAFMLPIATPPNAIAMSSGVLTIKQMAKFGFVFNIIAIVLTSTIALILW